MSTWSASPFLIAFSTWLKPAVTGRVGSSSWQMSVSRFATFQPSASACSRISLPMLHITTLGWLRSRRIMSRRSRSPHSVEVLAVAVLHLGLAPHVEGLVHDEEAHPVGGLEQLRGRRVVAGADGVRAHLFRISSCRSIARRFTAGAERPEVVVVAHALAAARAGRSAGSPSRRRTRSCGCRRASRTGRGPSPAPHGAHHACRGRAGRRPSARARGR